MAGSGYKCDGNGGRGAFYVKSNLLLPKTMRASERASEKSFTESSKVE
jgi:DnaJ-class molecular chaperone